MSDIASRPRTKVKLKTERPRLHKVILVNDDYTRAPNPVVYDVALQEELIEACRRLSGVDLPS